MCSQNQAMVILGEVYRCCNSIFDHRIQDAYLYGSYARGDFHTESDVDILLTVDMQPEQIASIRRCLGRITSELSLKHDVTVSLTVKPLNQFQQYAHILPYYQNVLREGIRYVS